MIKEQDFEREYNSTPHVRREATPGFNLPEEVEMADLLEFNRKAMSQVWALLNPSQFQPG